MVDSRGLQDLLALFDFEKKSDLERHAKLMTVSGADLFKFIVAAESSLIGYDHLIHHREIIPEQLRITAADLSAMANSASATGVVQGAGRSTLNKVKQTFKTRRLLVGHLFSNSNSNRWHFFYFDQRDYIEAGNRWQHGAHIHFLNYLWPEYSIDGLREQFTTGNPKLRGSVHIRFADARADA